MKKKVIIIGAGPSGITAAFEILKDSENRKKFDVVILEETSDIGGISKTVKHNGHRMDIGGHRFFSKDDKVMQWWNNLMPVQGSPSKDDIILNADKPFAENGPDPEKEDKVLLIRKRVSRILYLRKFFDYPVSIKFATFKNMGLIKTFKAGIGYLKSAVIKRDEKSLEDFMINRFGKQLYNMFFKDYTEKVWGEEPKNISASWGAQRIKGLSLMKALKNAVLSPFQKNKKDLDQKNKETSLIDQFFYPKFGPGQLWELAAKEATDNGAKIIFNANVNKIIIDENDENKITAVECQDINGRQNKIEGDVFISTMPVKDLVLAIDKEVPKEIIYVAENLKYRDFITVGILIKKLNLKNKTKIKTVSDIVPDTWIYIQEPEVKIGRLQIFNNWSPYLVKDIENTVWVGLEYFCNEGDEMWNMSKEDFIEFAKNELIILNIINKEDLLDAVQFKVKKAYPAYFGTYERFDEVKNYLEKYNNLYCIGRNGQHRYNNMDHSMLTAFIAAKSILDNGKNKSDVWSVNVEESYHETKSGN